MKNPFVIVLLAALCVGCATQSERPSGKAQIPDGTQALLDNSYRLIEAFNKGDSKTWSELVCGAARKEDVWGLSAVKFFRKFSSPRLVSISSVSEAGNTTGQYQSPKVAIEVKADGYPVGNLLLSFSEYKDEKCIGLSF